ncbi:3-oxoacyl-[acyl-carrier] synthase chloroplastic isoform B [Micractinium conductrix]|uniref:3-oxoacyl-[acyl-carrier-protein] synthase I, chloroplastic n=1 Tax=Micractinium conductrix TaxID=554055 RepID=A0A2P6VKP7_9CHLO|nr:3-oxoacyl-[acyl-carrier] synthase chloroplastic isoform B [Micractinium conductrix]|eukprot:PSC74659.1 3-oxoacyl-[acyl-carrier] synthase chloroplastic isoform B [Micractinium conductrix]
MSLACLQQGKLQLGSKEQLSSAIGSRQHAACFRPAAARLPRRHRRAVAAAAAAATDAARRRVVVTGQGVVSSLGHDPDTFYNNLLAGKSGVSLIEGWDTSDFSTRFAGQIKEQPDCDGLMLKKWERRVDSVMRYMMVAGKKALGDAGLPWEGPELKDLDRQRCGVLVGTAMGGMQTFATAVEALQTGYKKMNPFCIPFAISNMGGAMLAMDIGFMGPNYPISTACATGNYCILSAADHIRRGDADLMLAGGAEATVIPAAIGGFIACKALSKRNDDPAAASRPWDQDRDGFVMGEGAGVLVLEELEHAKARGANILAEFVGGAFTCDAHHMTEPQPEGKGVIMCIEQAMQRSGVAPEEVNYVNAHATSTPAGDMAEYRAITTAIPHKDLRINSTKSMIGHLLGAAGAVEAIAAVQAIRTGYVHPNLNLDTPEEGVDLSLIVGAEKQALDVNVALSNSFGFGGHNSCIITTAAALRSGPMSSLQPRRTPARACPAPRPTPAPQRPVSVHATPPTAQTAQRPSQMLEWLQASGAGPQKVTVRTESRNGREVDVVVAAEALQPGDVAINVPESLIITLDRVLEDNALGELLTTGKLSELACLTLYLAYEKKRGTEGCWFHFIKELDRMQGRGSQGAKSPLLWAPGEAAELLAGSPVVGEIEARLAGIAKEYEELDAVWFLAGSLFNRQPFAPPTEQFPLDVFIQAFTAVQSCVVHLQGVPLGKRFALVPLGPPLLSYSSTSKAMLKYDPTTYSVKLEVDRAFAAGEPLAAWCGPQPNSRLLINYGLVDENNPYDKLPLSITIPSEDPLYRMKRDKLAEQGLSTQQTFQLTAAAPLPPQLLPYLRVVHATRAEDVAVVQLGEGVTWQCSERALQVAPENELTALNQLITVLRLRLSRYRTTIEEDEAVIADPTVKPRHAVAARLLRSEKGILNMALAAALALPGGEEAASHTPIVTAVKMV